MYKVKFVKKVLFMVLNIYLKNCKKIMVKIALYKDYL